VKEKERKIDRLEIEKEKDKEKEKERDRECVSVCVYTRVCNRNACTRSSNLWKKSSS